MSEQSVKEYLKKYNMDDKIITLPNSIATVALAAQELGCEEARIAKTLSFELSDRCILIVAAGDTKIDNAKYKAEFGEKAKMISFDDVEEKIGHPVGGVCPFAAKDDVDVYLDESIKRFTTVFPACGSTNNAIELTPTELEKTTGYTKWIDVCKLKEQ
ncbi:MAG: YbaK/EbsC family protein [Clostridiales bacterium]|nr:YbaK/EbsC family protein [Clostridiales bacterium]